MFVVTSDYSLTAEIGGSYLILVSNAIEDYTWFDQKPQTIIRPVEANANPFAPTQIRETLDRTVKTSD